MPITCLLLVLEVWDGKPSYRKSWAGILLVWSDLTFGPLLQGQIRTAKLKSAYKSLIIGLKFTGYVPHYKILTGNIFGLILKNKMAATGVSLSVMKRAYISLIIGLEVWDGKPTCRKSWAGNLLVWSDLTFDPSFKVKRG